VNPSLGAPRKTSCFPTVLKAPSPDCRRCSDRLRFVDEAGQLFAAEYAVHVDAVVAARVLQKLLQGVGAAQECDFLPGNVFLAEKSCFESFFPDTVATDQSRRKEQMHLPGLDYVDRGKKMSQLDFCTGFFAGFPHGPFAQRLAEFHETGGNGPESAPRLDRAPAQQDASVLFRNAANHYFRVLIMNLAAALACPSQAVVALRDFLGDGAAALRTIFHLIKGKGREGGW